MYRFPILKALSGEQKVFKLFVIGLDKRQGVIVVVSVFGYWMAYKQLTKVVPLTTAQALVLFGPLFFLALFVAFVKYDGRHFDWWMERKITNAMRPKKLLWRRSRAGRKPLRDSVQEALPAEKIYWEMLRSRDGTYLICLEVQPVSLSLAGVTEQQRIWAAVAQLYNRIDFPIVEITRSREGNVKTYAGTLKRHIVEEVKPHERDLADFARDHLSFLEQMVPLYNVYDRKGYVLLPYKPENPDKKGRHKKRPKVKDAVRLQEEAEEAYRMLAGRYEVVVDAFSRIGARLRLLSDLELLEFLKGQASGEEDGPPPKMWEPVTLEVGGYGSLAPHKLGRVIKAAQKVRKATVKKGRKPAPPAVGIGDLTLADKISPDAVRIHPDYVRVGNRYHATLFMYDWPPDVGFGDLRGLLSIPGRVKLVKYVKPLSQDKAVNILGGKVAELTAAEHTASDGDVISANQRAIARYSAEQAMSELQTGTQGFFDLSFLIHCEASSKEALASLVQSVKTKLAGIRADAKLAREESWEGFVSSLGFKNLLSRRYANSGMLTNALACLFVYGSYQIDHPDGVLMGIDPYSGGLIVLDSRELVNPHMVVLGTSGGGKTVTVKALSTRLRMRGHRVVVIDPEGNSGYGRVARAINGQYVVFGVGSPHKFNPCDLGKNYMNISLLASASDAEDEDPEEVRRRALAGALDGKILMLTRLLDLMISGDDGRGGLNATEYGLVDRVWHEVYAEKGVTSDPDTHGNEPPTMRDFFRRLGDYPELKGVRDRLYPWEHGALSDIFDSHTNVDLDNKYLVLQIAGVKGREKAAIMYALLDFLNGQLSNPEEPSDCFIDEFWSLLKYKMASEFAEEMFRSGRARNNAMIAITQEITEFLGSPAGQVIMRISAAQLLLKQQKKTVEIIDEFVDLSEEQKRQIITFQKGEGYLIVEDNQVPVYVVCSPQELRIFNTDAKKEAAYKRAEAAEQPDAAASSGAAGFLPDGSPHPVSRLVDELLAENGATGGRRNRPPEDTTRELVSPESATRELTPPEGPPASPAQEVTEQIVRGAAEDAEEAGKAAQEAADQTHRLAEELPPFAGLQLPETPPGQAPVLAVVGEESSLVAYNLAGLLARAGKEQGRRILFADAEGRITRTVFAPLGQPAPDDLLVAPEEPDVVPYLQHDAYSDLCVIGSPDDTRLPAMGLIGRLRTIFDCIVVACGDSMYADDWLRTAGGVASTGAGWGAALAAARIAEDERGANGTILASLGPAGDPAHPAETRPLFELPPGDAQPYEATRTEGSFATLSDRETGNAFKPLLQELLRRARDGARKTTLASGIEKTPKEEG